MKKRMHPLLVLLLLMGNAVVLAARPPVPDANLSQFGNSNQFFTYSERAIVPESTIADDESALETDCCPALDMALVLEVRENSKNSIPSPEKFQSVADFGKYFTEYLICVQKILSGDC